SESVSNPTTPSVKEVIDFIDFVNASPSPFHAVDESRKRLTAAGFKELKERDNWSGQIERNGKYFFTRNTSTIVAFAIGGKYEPGNGVSIIGAHTDSPCLKVKPISKKGRAGYLQVGVETYGGGLWHTWFDRDLSIAGRVMLDIDGTYQNKLVRISRPILRVPTLAIHLDPEVSNGFSFNKETHLTPLIATAKKRLGGEDTDTQSGKHHPELLHTIAQELNVDASKIMDFELCLYDTQPPTIGGVNNEFIFSARLDNLMMSYTALTALINTTHCSPTSLEKDPNIRLVVLFDNEEVGSVSAHGAASSLLEYTIRRLVLTNVGGRKDVSKTVFEETIHKSFLISADMSHAVHPNYSEKHEENHKPHMHGGVVVKINANQRYATTAATIVILRQAAKKSNVPLQEYVVRADGRCGSTIGPVLSSNLGLRTIDVGNPQLSMHSIRETAGTDDVAHAIRLFESFFEHYPEIDANTIID
ncbi:2338_t:CDS:10, partial [Paraglomus brasilianum]